MRIPFLSNGELLPPLSDEECEAILELTRNSIRMAFVVGFNTGISETDLLRLRNSDFDALAQTLNIYEKNRTRRVVIPYNTTQQLKDYLKTHNSLYLFPFPATSFRKVVSDVGNRLGIRLTWQRVRSTYIKNASVAGVPILTCAHNVGTNPANIIHYFRLTPEEERMLVDRIGTKR
jgi:integrase